MVEGVEKGYEKKLELVGVGYEASNQGQKLDISVGYSHNIVFEIPSEVKLETVSEKGQPPVVILKSIDKQLIGVVKQKSDPSESPEPYKGKGIKYTWRIYQKKSR